MPRRGTLLRSGQYDNCAKRYSVSSSEAKPRYLCRARMRRNEQEENKRPALHARLKLANNKNTLDTAGPS